jgi:hypothetical protein|tara:strand:- start:1371 stop:1484 length:114 start_codon:yes stop_codon:yes gene_type:complete
MIEKNKKIENIKILIKIKGIKSKFLMLLNSKNTVDMP